MLETAILDGAGEFALEQKIGKGASMYADIRALLVDNVAVCWCVGLLAVGRSTFGSGDLVVRVSVRVGLPVPVENFVVECFGCHVHGISILECQYM